MFEQPGWKGSMAVAALATALGWSPAVFAVEAEIETESAASEAPVYHSVQPGETLWDIAERYGTSTARLIRENEIEDAKKIWVGTRLRIPTSAAAKPVSDIGSAHGARNSESPEIARLLDRCEAELLSAHFEQALVSAGEARHLIDARQRAGDERERVRLEIASATAYVALGQTDAALASLERALAADPSLELDPALTSPKVLAVFRAARSSAPPAGCRRASLEPFPPDAAQTPGAHDERCSRD